MTTPQPGQQPYGQQQPGQQQSPYGQQPYASGSYPGAAQPGYTAPPGYAAPPSYTAQPGYTAPPAYAAQPYPQPGYPPAAYPHPAAVLGPARPGIVTAAAVLSFIWGGIAILIGIGVGLLGSVTGALEDGFGTGTNFGTAFVLIAIAYIVVAGLFIAGGVTALNGSNGILTVVAAGILIVVQIVFGILSRFDFSDVIGVIVPVLIIVFMLATPSREWLRIKGGKSF